MGGMTKPMSPSVLGVSGSALVVRDTTVIYIQMICLYGEY